MGNARSNLVGFQFRPAAAAVALALLSGSAHSASLGDADVRSFQGQQLDTRIAISQTVPVSLAGAEPPGKNSEAPAIGPARQTEQAATPSATREEQPAISAPPQRSSLSIVWTTTAGETLRAIVRGLYPASVALQDAYIAKMRAENPGLDQQVEEPLAAGLKIALPDMLVFANESPRFAKPEPVRGVATARSSPAVPARQTPPATAALSSQAPASADRPRRRSGIEKTAPAPVAAKPASSSPLDPLPVAKASRAPPAQAGTPDHAPRIATADDGAFRLRLSGAEMDLSRSRGVTEATRAALRDKQLMFDADDQIAAFLALKNTVKDLESRINEMQVVLNASTQLSAAAAARPAAPMPKASSPPAPEAAPPATGSSPASPQIPAQATESPKTSAPIERPQERPQAEPKASTPIEPPQPEPKVNAATSALKPVEKSPLRPSRAVETAWWENIWLWGAVGFLAVMGIVYMLIRPRTPRPGLLGSPSSSLPAGRTSGFSNWASKPPEDEQDMDADEVRDLVESRDQAATLGTTAESYDRTVTRASTPGERVSRPVSAPNSASQLPQRIAGPDDDGMASLELDTRPGMHIDFPLIGDEGAEDKARRLRYMEERFPELADGTISIDNPDSIIDAARHHFEDGKLLLASELLTYAFEEHPGQLRYWLALFEIYRLERKVTEFNTLAVRFKNVHAGTDAWPKVQHIGREFDPLNPLYAAALGQLGVPEDQEFDPIAENWLNVPMDFTSDALMAELRRSLLDEHGVDPGELKRLSVATYS
jgi:pilus assembly protein FimV